MNTGAQRFFDQPQDSAVFYVVQTQGACSSEALLVALNVTPTPNDAQVNATSPVCLGAPFALWLSNATKGAFRGDHLNGEPLSDGTYYYEPLFTRAGGSLKPYSGYFSLLR